jgi:hypothetical protein
MSLAPRNDQGESTFLPPPFGLKNPGIGCHNNPFQRLDLAVSQNSRTIPSGLRPDIARLLASRMEFEICSGVTLDAKNHEPWERRGPHAPGADEHSIKQLVIGWLARGPRPGFHLSLWTACRKGPQFTNTEPMSIPKEHSGYPIIRLQVRDLESAINRELFKSSQLIVNF